MISCFIIFIVYTDFISLVRFISIYFGLVALEMRFLCWWIHHNHINHRLPWMCWSCNLLLYWVSSQFQQPALVECSDFSMSNSTSCHQQTRVFWLPSFLFWWFLSSLSTQIALANAPINGTDREPMNQSMCTYPRVLDNSIQTTHWRNAAVCTRTQSILYLLPCAKIN